MKRTLLLMMLLIFATISNSFVIAGEISQKVTSNIFVEVDPRELHYCIHNRKWEEDIIHFSF